MLEKIPCKSVYYKHLPLKRLIFLNDDDNNFRDKPKRLKIILAALFLFCLIAKVLKLVDKFKNSFARIKNSIHYLTMLVAVSKTIIFFKNATWKTTEKNTKNIKVLTCHQFLKTRPGFVQVFA